MPENVQMQGIEFQIIEDSDQAVKSINALSSSLKALKSATGGGISGLGKTATQVNALKNALKSLNTGDAVSKLSKLSSALQTLGSSSQGIRVGTIAKNISSLSSAISEIKESDGQKIASIANGLKPLSQLGRSNMTSFINQLKKLPDVIDQLENADLDKFTRQMKELAEAMKPFADEMQKVSTGFSAFPSRIQKVIASTEQYNAAMSNQKSSGIMAIGGGLKLAGFYFAIRQVSDWISTAITKSNEYQENLNLFTVAMGEYADQAYEYGKTVSEVLGIDFSQWIRNQGVFNTLLTGFGNASDRAAIMSKNLTQLGYDLSSFFNISVDDAMQKLQSGISGELEPLRRLGFDLSQARLEQEALNLGIDKSVVSMTQAEKAELRYYAIMTQVTTAQGDLARTLEAPANQLRILQAQFTMAAQAIGNIFIPALNAILPYAIAVVQVIREIADAIASFFGFKLAEVDYSGISNGLAGVEDQADGVADSFGDAASSAAKLKKYIAGFDELNVLPDQSAGTGGGAGGSGIGAGASGGGLGFELPEYDFLGDAVSTKVGEIKQMITENLAEIQVGLGAFALAIGTILVLSGNLVPGIALMATGATAIATAAPINWSTMSETAKAQLGTLMEVVGIGFFALGAILALSGNIPLGIGLMVVGAATIAGGAGVHASVNWSALEDPIGTALEGLDKIVEVALLAIGSVLAFSGVNLPLGIALIAGGAVGMASGATLGWESLNNEVKDAIALVTATVSVAFLALGAILAFSGTNIPLGIGLMAAGAVAIGGAIAPNWNSLSPEVRRTISTITGIVGGGMLALGAILALSGVGVPIGIGLMLAGAASLGVSAGLNWDTVTSTVRKVVSYIAAIVSGSLAAIGILLCLSGVGVGLGLALLFAGLKGSHAAWKLDNNPVTNFVRNIANGIINILNTMISKINDIFHIRFDGLTIAGVQIIPSFDARLINIPRIPTFAEGGFVDQGQLFVARESGAEMVGSIGRRTAVANNDQIVESVSEGVSVANIGVIQAIKYLTRVLEEKEFSADVDSNKITRAQNNRNRMFGHTLQNV